MPDGLLPASLTVRSLHATPVQVPLNFVLGTSATAVREAPLLLVDLNTEEGITGRTYLFCYLPAAAPAIVSLLAEVERVVKGECLDPRALWSKLARRFTLIGVQGIVRMAMSACDSAGWDALAIAAGVPLCTLMGAEPRLIPAYNSCGLGLMDDLGALADEAEKLLVGGFRAVKLRLGYQSLRDDIAAVRAVRARIGEDIHLMVDYNQALTVEDALVRGRALEAENIYWLEEPIRHDDYEGAALLARELRVPIQIGENFSLPAAMSTALKNHAADYVMPDLERIGGVTGWGQAAELARPLEIKMSSHLFPEFSAHLLAATPTCHFLEYVDWANVILQEPLRVVDGQAVVPTRPGAGITWDKKAVERYRMR
ncbi:MAG TPA: enolase C-terminal domain-like protein [Pseudolabrys sp.]|nr:enolase C-terminal domain-like protein [Pseudolabrys sp.]